MRISAQKVQWWTIMLPPNPGALDLGWGIRVQIVQIIQGLIKYLNFNNMSSSAKVAAIYAKTADKFARYQTFNLMLFIVIWLI